MDFRTISQIIIIIVFFIFILSSIIFFCIVAIKWNKKSNKMQDFLDTFESMMDKRMKKYTDEQYKEFKEEFEAFRLLVELQLEGKI